MTDIPFTNGAFFAGTDAFNSLSDQGYDVDAGLYLMELIFLESQYLANLIKTPERNNTASDLVISSEADCEKIKEKGWKSITVNNDLCNSMTDLDISFYPYLEWIRVENYSLQKIHSLTISSKMIRNF